MAHFDLSEGIKRRILLELREFWAKHPKYRDTLKVQGKFSFDERPQQAIIVKSGSASTIRFSADNYQGMVVSYCALAGVAGKPGTSIEWVREDGRAIQRNGGTFPSPMGVYWVGVRQESISWQGVTSPRLVYYIDPLLAVIDGRPSRLSALTYQLPRPSYQPGSLVIYEMPGNLPLYSGVNYSADPQTGRIELVRPLPAGTYLSADFYWRGTSSGPFVLQENHADNTSIPGVVLAFGRGAQEGDAMAVIVGEHREAVAQEYGGKFEVSVDLDITARDVHAQGELADSTLFYIQGELRDRLSYEGIEIDQSSLGGESEEPYDENADDYYYTATLSMTVMTDWSIHRPLGPAISRVLPHTVQSDKILSAAAEEELAALSSLTTLRLTQRLGLQLVEDPYFRDRTSSFEMIR